MIKPRYSPEYEIAQLENKAISRCINRFIKALKTRINRAIEAGIIETWHDVANMAQLQTLHDNLCAKPNKDEGDLVDISAISLLLLNFVDDGEEV